MEAPKLNQLLEVAEKRNGSWYPFIHGYLKGELQNLELDDDYFVDEYSTLDIGKFSGCVVGETLGFSDTYKHNGFNNCFICGEFAIKLYNNSNIVETDEQGNDVPEVEVQREQFAETLRDFYIHRGYMK